MNTQWLIAHIHVGLERIKGKCQSMVSGGSTWLKLKRHTVGRFVVRIDSTDCVVEW